MQRLGIRLPVGEATVHIHMQFACFLSDEKAEKEALGVKGASGTKMCVSCQNCVKVDVESLRGSELGRQACQMQSSSLQSNVWA